MYCDIRAIGLGHRIFAQGGVSAVAEVENTFLKHHWRETSPIFERLVFLNIINLTGN